MPVFLCLHTSHTPLFGKAMEAGLRNHGSALAKVAATNAALESFRPVTENQDEFWKEKRGQGYYGAGLIECRARV